MVKLVFAAWLSFAGAAQLSTTPMDCGCDGDPTCLKLCGSGPTTLGSQIGKRGVDLDDRIKSLDSNTRSTIAPQQ